MPPTLQHSLIATDLPAACSIYATPIIALPVLSTTTSKLSAVFFPTHKTKTKHANTLHFCFQKNPLMDT